jgi:RimJ/RimL family protein N-acetyltransferase
LFCRAVATNLFPHSFFGMGEFGLYSLEARDRPETTDGDERFSLAFEGRDAIPDLVRCYESANPAADLELFRNLYQENTELWCARDIRLSDRPVVAAAWLFRRQYVFPLGGYEQFSIRLDVQDEHRVFLGTVYVHSGYRRRGLYSRLVAAITKGGAELQVFAWVDADNRVSTTAHEKIGFRRVGTICYVRAGRRMWCYIRAPGIARRFWQIRRGKRLIVAMEGGEVISGRPRAPCTEGTATS